MKVGIFIFALVLSTLCSSVSCNKSDSQVKVSECIEKKINEFRNNEVQNPPASVTKWEVDGKIFYYIPAGCCDQYNLLYDENCNIVCAPDGGFTGLGDGSCPEFKGEIVKTLIWTDPRK